MITGYRDLRVFQNAFEGTLQVFEATKAFPPDEKYSLTDQIRRSSRSVCANLAEAWWKRRYRAAFVAKITDSQAEAAETQFWLELSKRFGYVDQAKCDALTARYDHILAQLVRMVDTADNFLIR